MAHPLHLPSASTHFLFVFLRLERYGGRSRGPWGSLDLLWRCWLRFDSQISIPGFLEAQQGSSGVCGDADEVE